MWLDVFNEMRKKSGMSLDEISIKSGIPKGTLSKITAGITKAPPLETMRKLVYSMGYTLDDLDRGLEVSDNFSAAEKAHIKKYRLISPNWKEAVDGVLDIGYREYEEQQAARKEQLEQATADLREQQGKMEAGELMETEKIIRFRVSEYTMPVSAGVGECADLEFPKDIDLVKAPPHGTSFIAHVSGISMEPTYHDGDMVFVHATVEIPVGKIGVFLMDGKQWIKELGNEELISHNSKYKPIPMRDDIKCQGLVLGVCDESYFE